MPGMFWDSEALFENLKLPLDNPEIYCNISVLFAKKL
jgi:hypothetical protein